MTSSNNTGFISKMAVDPTTGRLVDAIDYPHSGLFKALNEATRGNYAILGAAGSAAKFDITQTAAGSNTQFVVAAGQLFRDGELKTVATSTFTSGTPSTFDEPTSGNAYFLLVATSASPNILAIRGNKANTDVIPDLTAGDIPLAVIKLDAGGTDGSRLIQFLTTGKNASNLSVGYNASGYSEKGTFSASASGLAIGGTTATIVTTPFMSLGNGATNAGALRLLEDTDNGAHYTGFKAPAAVTANTLYTLPADYPASNKILQSTDAGILSWESDSGAITALNSATVNELVTVGATTTELDAESNLKFDGSTLTITGGLSLGAAGELTVTESSDDITFKNTVSDKDLIFNVKYSLRGASSANAEFMRIDTSTQRLGINQSAPTTMFDIKNKLNTQLSGTVTTTNASVTINGSGTSFTALFPGQIVKIGSEIRTISIITSDTVMTVTTAFTSAGSGVVSGGYGYIDDLFLTIQNGEGTEIMGIGHSTLINLNSGIKNNVRVIDAPADGVESLLSATDRHIIVNLAAVPMPGIDYVFKFNADSANDIGRIFTIQCVAIGGGAPFEGTGVDLTLAGSNVLYDVNNSVLANSSTVLQLVAGKSYTIIQQARHILRVLHKTV